MLVLSTVDQIAEARESANTIGALRGSITSGQGNLVGMIGESIVHRTLGGLWEPTYEYDIVIEGIKYDVKTKSCTSAPRISYDASISNWNPDQDCDRYIFTRIEHTRGSRLNLTGRGWILGWITKEEYFDLATFYKKGDVDPNGNGWKFKGSCFNLAYDQLNSIESLME